jgi:hypothetical protein
MFWSWMTDFQARISLQSKGRSKKREPLVNKNILSWLKAEYISFEAAFVRVQVLVSFGVAKTAHEASRILSWVSSVSGSARRSP